MKQEPKSAPKKPVLKDIEDVISIGALLRPTFFKAISGLSFAQKQELIKTLTEIESELAKSSASFTQRFKKTNELFARTFGYGPIWRFIAGRVQEVWSEVEKHSVKELSIVSLLVGMLFEETQSQLESSHSKDRQSA